MHVCALPSHLPLSLLKALAPPPRSPELDHFGRPVNKEEADHAGERFHGNKPDDDVFGKAGLDGDEKDFLDNRHGDRGEEGLFARRGNPRGGDQGAKRIINSPVKGDDIIQGPMGVNNFGDGGDDNKKDDGDDNNYGDDDADYGRDGGGVDDGDNAYNPAFQVQQPRLDDGKAGAMGGMGPQNPDPVVGNMGVDGDKDAGMKGPLGQGQMDRPDQMQIPLQGELENQVLLTVQRGSSVTQRLA